MQILNIQVLIPLLTGTSSRDDGDDDRDDDGDDDDRVDPGLREL